MLQGQGGRLASGGKYDPHQAFDSRSFHYSHRPIFSQCVRHQEWVHVLEAYFQYWVGAVGTP